MHPQPTQQMANPEELPQETIASKHASRLHLHDLADLHASIVEHLTENALANLLLASKATYSLFQPFFPHEATFYSRSWKSWTKFEQFYTFILVDPKTRGVRLRKFVFDYAVCLYYRDEPPSSSNKVMEVLRHTTNLRVLEIRAADIFLSSTLPGLLSSPVDVALVLAGLTSLTELQLYDFDWRMAVDALKLLKAPLKEVHLVTTADVDLGALLAPFTPRLRSVNLSLRNGGDNSITSFSPYIWSNTTHLSLSSYRAENLGLRRHETSFPNITHLSVCCAHKENTTIPPALVGCWPFLQFVMGDYPSVDALSLPSSLRKLQLFPPSLVYGQPHLRRKKEFHFTDTAVRVLTKAKGVTILQVTLDGLPEENMWSVLCEMRKLQSLEVTCVTGGDKSAIERLLIGLIDALVRCTALRYLCISFSDHTPAPTMLEKNWTVDRLIQPLAECSQSIRYVECPEVNTSWELRRQGCEGLVKLSLSERERVRRRAIDDYEN